MILKLVYLCLVSAALAQDYQDYQQRPAPSRISTGQTEVKPTPIPILKQINKHNEDGSYTYGYEGADGSFKIETKLATGEVKGKYGYVDESSGKVRVVEYGANKYGFQPSGEGITVAPPTLVDESTDKNGQQIDYDNQEQEQDQHQQKQYIARVPRPQSKPQRPQQIPQHQPQYQYEQQEQPQQYTVPEPQRPQFPDADVVYSARPRPARPNPEYNQQQTFIPSPQVREESYESPIARSFPSQRPVPQQQPIAYSAPRAASHFSQPQPQQQLQHQQPQQQQLLHQQAQQHQPQPQQRFNVQPAPSQQRGSVLDQLAKDFALPQGGSPALHDLTYTYY